MFDKESVISLAMFGPKLHHDLCKPPINSFREPADFVICLCLFKTLWKTRW